MLRMFENRVLRKTVGLQTRKILETGEKCTKSSFITFSLHNIQVNKSRRMAELCVHACDICRFVFVEYVCT
jgi:hypothetical protein